MNSLIKFLNGAFPEYFIDSRPCLPLAKPRIEAEEDPFKGKMSYKAIQILTKDLSKDKIKAGLEKLKKNAYVKLNQDSNHIEIFKLFYRVTQFLDLPLKVIENILSFVPPSNHINIALVSRFFNVLITKGPINHNSCFFYPFVQTTENNKNKISFFELAIKLNRTERIEKYINFNIDLLSSEDLNKALCWACKKGHLEIVKKLLADKRVDPSAKDNVAIRRAAENGQVEVVKVLLADKRVDASANNHCAFQQAATEGHWEVVKVLLTDERIKRDDIDYAFRMAVYNGHLEIVKEFLENKRVDPSACQNDAIRGAAARGYLEIVKVLLIDKRVDPSECQNDAIRGAAAAGHSEVVKVLLADPRVVSDLNRVDNLYNHVLLTKVADSHGRTDVVSLLQAKFPSRNEVDRVDKTNSFGVSRF